MHSTGTQTIAVDFIWFFQSRSITCGILPKFTLKHCLFFVDSESLQCCSKAETLLPIKHPVLHGSGKRRQQKFSYIFMLSLSANGLISFGQASALLRNLWPWAGSVSAIRIQSSIPDFRTLILRMPQVDCILPPT